MKKSIFYIVVFISSWCFAQEDVQILSEIDTTQIRIGEQFEYTITVDKTSDVVFPKLEALGGLEVVSESKIDTLVSSLVKKYQLTGFDSGSFYIPKQQVFLESKAYFTDSLLVNVATVAVDTLKQKPFPIKPIIDEPVIFDDYRPYFIWLYVLLSVLVLVTAIYFILKKYYGDDSANKKEQIPPYQEAVEKFASLEEKQLWQNNKTKEYYIELTEILRVYIGREVKIQTLEATSDELIRLISNKNKEKEIGIDPSEIKTLAAFLKHADFVKFAKLRPLADEIENDRATAANIVEALQPVLKKYKQANLLIDDEYSRYVKAEAALTPSEKRKRTLSYLGMFVLVIAALSFGTFQVLKLMKMGAASISQIEIPELGTNEVWEKQSFGTPALTLHAPVSIPLRTNEVPQHIQTVLSSLGVYEYNHPQGLSKINITTLSYAGINAQIEQVMENTIKGMQQQPNVEDFEYERQPANLKNGMQGVYLSGNLKESGVEKEFKVIGFTHENLVWQVITICNEDEDEIKTMLGTLIDSINIEIE
ncbi:BatD family protein [Flavicella sediminum]|uniref:hypothetical protein n=1 Tax=Flavicella sediminum TaxID=2585141 RepID=UPI00111DA6E6|nr:hypothetical protein [Flavicella sediminum]